MKRSNRLFAILLAVAMAVTYMPAMAFAGTGEDPSGSEEYSTDEVLWTAEAEEMSVFLSKTNPEAELVVVVDTSECEIAPELSFQWYILNVDGEYELISDASSSTYTAVSEGNYQCVVTDEAGNTQEVWFYVTEETEWTVMPKEREMFISKSVPEAELEVVVDITACEVDPELSYQWYKYNEDTYEREEIEGATSTTYSANSEGHYECAVTDKEGHYTGIAFEVAWETEWIAEAKKDEAFISKSSPETELEVVVDTSACESDPELSYQWYKYNEEDHIYETIEGVTSATYTANSEGGYSCEVTDEENHSNTIYFWVSYETEWTAEALEEDAIISKSISEAELKVVVDTTACEVDPELSYQWYKYNEDTYEREEIEGATSTTYTADSEGDYYCEVTDKEGYSNTVEFWVSYETDWTAEAKEEWVLISDSDEEAKLEVIVDVSECDSDPELSYQWYKVVTGDEDKDVIEGAIDSVFLAPGEGEYSCDVTDKDGHSINISFMVSMWKAYAEKEDVYLTNGTAELKVLTESSKQDENYQYQWHKWDEEKDTEEKIEGATDATYIAKEAGAYLCEVTVDFSEESRWVWFEVYDGSDEPTHEHIWDEGEVTTAPTCSGKGEMTYTCTECGETKTEEIPATGVHAESEPVRENVVDATCTEEGSYDEVVYCKYCNTELSRETKTIEVKAHTAGEAVRENEVAASCKAEGSYDEVVYCTVCNSEISRTKKTVPVLEHTWNDGEVTTAPTCEDEGVKTFTCTVCNEKKTEEIPALGHAWGEWTKADDTQHQRVCSHDASHVEKAAHNWGNGVINDPESETEARVKTYKCSDCGATKEEPYKSKLDEAKENAIAELDATNLAKYSEPEKTKVKNAIDEAKTAIKNAESIADVNTAIETANNTIKAQKTDAQKQAEARKTAQPKEIVDLPVVKISKPKAGKKKATVKWKKVSKKNLKKIQGIEIQVATDPGFKQIVKSTTAGKKKKSKTIKGLKPKTTYWVRIRAYKNASNGKHVSAWKVKKVKIKK